MLKPLNNMNLFSQEQFTVQYEIFRKNILNKYTKNCHVYMKPEQNVKNHVIVKNVIKI